MMGQALNPHPGSLNHRTMDDHGPGAGHGPWAHPLAQHLTDEEIQESVQKLLKPILKLDGVSIPGMK